MAGDLLKSGGRSGRRRAYGAHQLRAEINVTPFVDVMLVLLIVFMVSAPLLTVGVPINLPKASAPTLSANDDPITISIDESGAWFVGEVEVANELKLLIALDEAAAGNKDRKIYIRGDADLQYGNVFEVMGAVTQAGFSKLALISTPVGDGNAEGATPNLNLQAN